MPTSTFNNATSTDTEYSVLLCRSMRMRMRTQYEVLRTLYAVLYYVGQQQRTRVGRERCFQASVLHSAFVLLHSASSTQYGIYIRVLVVPDNTGTG